LHKGALGEEENDDDRQGDQHRCRHEQAPLAPVLAAVLVETELEGVELLIVEIDQRVEIVGPRADELEYRYGRQGGLSQGQNHRPEDAELVRAVDAGRLGELLGNGHKELTHQEDVEREAEELRQDQRSEVAHPAEVFEHQEDWNKRDLRRQHQGRDRDQKEEVAPGPRDARQAVGHQRTREDHTDHACDRDEEGVAEVGEEWHIGHRARVVLPHDRVGDPDRRIGEELLVGLERGRDHPQKGDEKDRRRRQEDDVGQDLVGQQIVDLFAPSAVRCCVTCHRCFHGFPT